MVIGSTLHPAQAQIRPDNTLGATPSTVRNNAGQFLIEGGASRGSTLFHSFSDFSIDSGGNAYFVNPASINVIVSRVTGNSASNFLGTLGVLGEADLFFINPNGIEFGPGASLDLGGSFVASTADSVVFGNEFVFSAVAPQAPPLLTVSTPTGLQFGQQPGPISFRTPEEQIPGLTQRTLEGATRETLALLGGDLDFQVAGLQASGGRIELGSIAAAGLVTIIPVNQGFTFDYGNIQDFGSLTAFRADINTTIVDFVDTVDPDSSSDEQDGDIVIQAGDIALERSTSIRSTTVQDTSAGDITINANRLTMRDGAQLFSSARASFPEDIRGSSGDIVLNVSEEIILEGGVPLSFSAFATGIFSFVSGETVNFFTGVRNGRAFGTGGDISINTQRLFVQDGAAISSGTSSVGNGGDIHIQATEFILIDGFLADALRIPEDGALNLFNSEIVTASMGDGNGGELRIETGDLILGNAGRLDSRSTGRGTGGIINIDADTINVSGSADPTLNISENNSFLLLFLPILNEVRSAITAATEGEGDAGEISINARTLDLEAGGAITTATQVGSSGNGNLLNIDVTEAIRIDGVSSVADSPSGLFSSTEGSGNAGEVRISTENLSISDRGEISAATLSETAESSGSLNLSVGRLFLDNGRLTVETQAQTGSGAEISISDLELLLMRNGGRISAEALNLANGGNINIDASEGIVIAPFEEDNDIVANANRGNGGNIDIVAQSILGFIEGRAIPNNGTNDIDASSEFGASGTVVLNELEVNPAVEDAELPADTGTPEIAQRCNPSQDVSSFVATGRGGVPPEPQATVPEILWRPAMSEAHSPSLPVETIATSQVLEAQGWQTNTAGQVVLTAVTTETIPHTIMSSVPHCSLTRSP